MGTQLALDNALAPYFEKNFGFGITKAANLAAIFGMLNFVARPMGGYVSDLMGRRYGMRGRIWVLFFVVACGGESPLSHLCIPSDTPQGFIVAKNCKLQKT